MTPQQALLPALARRLGAAALALALPLGALPALGDGPDGPPALPPGESEYPGDPSQEAAQARAEDLRIADVRSMVDSSRWAFAPGAPPLTLPTGGTSTVVLLAREEPYTLEELAEVVPEAVEREEDGDLLISSHLVIDRGATLRIRTEGEHAVHLESTPESFASLVSIGGTLDVAGAEGEPLRITGWDSSRDRADEETADGRAYLRALAGAVRARDVDLSDLGFWSGPTGGLALTGSDAPRIETAAGDVIADPGEESAVAPDPDSMVALPDPGQERAEDPTSATLERVSVRNGAMGLFAVNTAELDVHDAEFSDNLLDGVVLHRFVTGATLADVEAHRNGGDGVRAGRGTTDVSIERARTARNDRNGITLEGGSLADGPSATGVATGAFGGHTVTDSTVTRNGRYGIQVTGGTGMALHGNYVTGHRSGIVVDGPAEEVEVSDNRVHRSTQHGISLRDGITGAQLRGNRVVGADTAIYSRGSAGEISGNSVSRVTNHGITVIDQPGTTTLSRNTIAGRGPAAIDTSRSGTSVVSVANTSENWETTTPMPVILQRIFQPLTVLWLLIAAVLVVSARATVRGRPGIRPRSHPYADHTPLTELSAGLVLPGPHPGPGSARAASRSPQGRRRRTHAHPAVAPGAGRTTPVRGDLRP